MDGDSDHVSVGNSRLHSATCRDCGKRISDRTERCPACGVRRRSPPEPSLLASVESNLSLGAVERGAGFALAGVLVLAAPFAAGISPVFALPAAFALWLSALYDAYTRSDGTSGGE